MPVHVRRVLTPQLFLRGWLGGVLPLVERWRTCGTLQAMDDGIRAALFRSQVIDLTTTGRRTGRRRRIEIFLHEKDGLLFITGMPRADRTRDWIYNVAADPRVVVHLKQSVVADIPATARVVTDPDQRRPLIEAAAQRWGRTDIPVMLEHSPLIVLDVDGGAADRRVDG
jgi:deazaflavin-dependent oxidoreductase (nitroreductase family)